MRNAIPITQEIRAHIARGSPIAATTAIVTVMPHVGVTQASRDPTVRTVISTILDPHANIAQGKITVAVMETVKATLLAAAI